MSGSGRAARAFAAVALPVAVLATFSTALAPSRAFFERDIASYWYPHRAALRAALAQGSIPLWDPWSGFGAPFLADSSSAQLAYPPTWLLLYVPLALQFKLLAIGHALLAGAGAAALARRLGSGRVAAAAGGIAYSLAGPLLSALSMYHHFAGAAIMPWTLWALEGLLWRRDAKGALGLGAVAALEVLAGSGDLVLMTALVAMGRLALYLAETRGRGLASLAPRLALAAALAASISAVQWLPTLERGLSGQRAAQDYRTATYWSLHPASAVDLTVPRLVSDTALSDAERLRLFEGREPMFSCLYLGVVTLLLGATALVARERGALPAALGAVVFVLLSLGRHTPLYGLLFAVPGFSLVRYPQKYLLPAALCVALLAAAGAEALARARDWTEAQRRGPKALAWAGVALVLLVAIVAWRQPGDAQGALASLRLARTALILATACLLLFRCVTTAAAHSRAFSALLLLGAIDLVLVGRGTNQLAPASLYEHEPPALERLAHAQGRLHAATESGSCLAPGASPPGWQPAAVAALGFLDTLRPPSGMRWGLFGSYDGEFTGLGPRFSAAFTAAVRGGLGSPAALRLLQLAGVEHVAYLGHSTPAGLELVATYSTPLACPLQLLRVPGALPRAYVVGNEREEGASALEAVLDPAFDPGRAVVLPAAVPGTDRMTDQGRARVTSRSADALEVEAELVAPGVLVVSEAYDDGWVAEVDGRRVEMLRANGLFRAVRLGPGNHDVRFRYRPWSVEAGAAASVIGTCTALALAAAAVLGRTRN